MKIAVNTRFLIKDKLEGIGWYTYEVTRKMVADHPEDEFYFLFDRPYHSDFIFGDNVKPIHVPPPARHPWLFQFWFERSLPYFLNKIKPDVFFSPDNFCSLNYKGKTVLTVHDLAYRHFPEQLHTKDLNYYKKFMPKFIHRADQIIAISQATKYDIIDLMGDGVASKIEVIYNGVREEFKELDEIQIEGVRKKYAMDAPYLLYIGAIHPRKNVKRIVEAFTDFKKQFNSPLKLVLCGRLAWKSEEVTSAIETSAVKEDIMHHTHISAGEIPLLLGGADILLYPSLFEGFGLPIVEAFRANVPVITSSLSSMPEIAGDAARLIDPFDKNQLTEAIRAIYFDVNLQHQMKAKGRIRGEQFDWQNTADQIYRLLTHAF